ncbi:MAG: stage II sporulation protein D [Bacillota bacterium]|nr:stage II sporulation protein D [Bacillota bacterium]
MIYYPQYRRGRKNKRPGGFTTVAVLFFAVIALFGLGMADDGSAEKKAIEEGLPVQTVAKDESSVTDPVLYDMSLNQVELYRSEKGIREKLSLEDYITGVIAGEMPTDFAPEALKAQAVIARTYAAAVLAQGGELCDDPGHCQCYYDEEALSAKWGKDYQSKIAKCREAVTATDGEVILYNGEIAKTFFHSTCGGKTSSSAEVWGEDIPYLQSVECQWDTQAPRYQETVTLSLGELPYLLDIAGSPDTVPVAAGVTGSGRVETVSYGGQTIKATDFRKSLALNSTDFTITSQGDKVVISTKGFGHGVGLCQYGANGMAKQGYDYGQIIVHYYTGVTLGKLKE